MKAHDKIQESFANIFQQLKQELDTSRKQHVDQLQQLQIKNQNELREFSQLQINDFFDEIDQVETELRDTKRKIGMVNQTDLIDLQVGANNITVSRELLTSIKGSKMETVFSGDHTLHVLPNKRIFLDRNPQIFEHVLQYLRTRRSHVPINNNLESNLRELFEMEVKFWELDKGLGHIDALTNSLQKQKIEGLLGKVPQVDQKKQMKCIEMWRNLGPLSIEQIAENSEIPINFDEMQYEYHEKMFVNGQIIQGQFSRVSSKLNGIARIIYPNNVIYEGQTKDEMPHGFGRVLDASGEYYIGQYQDTLRHGYGIFVTADGTVHDGQW